MKFFKCIMFTTPAMQAFLCYKKIIEAYADIVLELFKNEKVKLFKNRRDKNSRDKNREKHLGEVAALAYLVKEDFPAAEKRFARAEKLYRKANKRDF